MTNSAPPPAASPAKPPLRERLMRFLTVRLLLTLLLTGAVAGIAAAVMGLSYRVLRQNKYLDARALYFLDMEAQAQQIARAVLPPVDLAAAFLPANLRPAKVPGATSYYNVQKTGSLAWAGGARLGATRLADFGVASPEDLVVWNSVTLKGKPLMALAAKGTAGTVLSLFPHPPIDIARLSGQMAKLSLVYVITRQGELVGTNVEELRKQGVKDRALVQHFIHLPVRQGQIELEDGKTKTRSFGFFTEIPQTNLVLFGETPAELIEASVNVIMRRLFLISLAIVLSALALAQAPIFVLLRPLKTLAAAAARVARGDFALRLTPESFGEVRQLGATFSGMIEGLDRRDKAITQLHAGEAEKFRLEGEMKLAQAIQGNLLTTVSPEALAGHLEFASIYEPASEVAGDWYGVFADEARRKIYAGIVDVSGHGAGSAVFTAIAAALFEELRADVVERGVVADPGRFFEALNRQLIRYGKTEWSATAQILELDLEGDVATLYNAGHPAPLVDTGAGFRRAKGIGAQLLGLDYTQKPNLSTFAFPPGARIILYTDGLIDRRDPKGKRFGAERLTASAARLLGRVERASLKAVIDANDAFAQGPRDDDICIVLFKNVRQVAA